MDGPDKRRPLLIPMYFFFFFLLHLLNFNQTSKGFESFLG